MVRSKSKITYKIYFKLFVFHFIFLLLTSFNIHSTANNNYIYITITGALLTFISINNIKNISTYDLTPQTLTAQIFGGVCGRICGTFISTMVN